MPKQRGVDVTAITMGSRAAAVRRRATPKQWRKIVRTAKRRGVTVESLVDQTVPHALKQRTRPALRREAMRTMNTVYAPVERELTLEEKRVHSIDEKRARDNQYYLDWLRSRTNEMQTAARAADDKLRDTQAQIVADASQGAASLRNEMMQAAAAQPGNVSNPQQATAFDITADVARNSQLLASQAQITNSMIGSAEKQRATMDASNFAMMAAAEARRTSDTWAKLSELGDEREKLQLSKAADAAKEVARLLDQETAKAESNREFQAVAQRLGVDMASIQQRDAASRRSARQQRLNRRAQNRREEKRLRLAERQQSFNEAMDEADLAIKQGNLDLGWYKATHPNKGKGGSGGGVGGDPMKSKDPQTRFEYGYALVATSVRQGKPRKDGTYPNKPYKPDWVAENQELVMNQLIKKGFSRRMAKTIVNAFLQKGGKEPGDVGRYRPDRHDVRGQ